MDVSQCFRCELRFASRAELEAHLRDEHATPPPDSPEVDSTPTPDTERDTPPTT